LKITQSSDRGFLQVNVTAADSQRPIEDAVVDIAYTSEPENILEELRTDPSGQTEEIELPTPPLEYSQEPSSSRPYEDYTITIKASGYDTLTISGSELLPDSISIQPARLTSIETTQTPENINIPEHTLYKEYPAKIPEAEVKPITEGGEIVLTRVVIPEYIIVHDGVPSDSSAPNYYIPYTDYIKNVACSEIYANWPKEAIVANVLAIQSFTMNRVYTEWYRGKGYSFTITSSTAYDQKFIYQRNILESISTVVDEIFDSYLSRPNVKQPIMTQYCDGQYVSCEDRGWMTQWGSKNLATNGNPAIDILRNFYGYDLYINSAEQISGVPISYPGYPLRVGSSGEAVRHLQELLNVIGEVYTKVGQLRVDGVYGSATQEAVKNFQSIFGLTPDGITGKNTWYKISQIYVGITRIAETV
jgi:hypothetical protein